MKSVSGRAFGRILERNGWNLLRVQGSHHIYGKPGEKARISVPVHSGTVLKKGLLRRLLRVAGLQEEDL